LVFGIGIIKPTEKMIAPAKIYNAGKRIKILFDGLMD